MALPLILIGGAVLLALKARAGKTTPTVSTPADNTKAPTGAAGVTDWSGVTKSAAGLVGAGVTAAGAAGLFGGGSAAATGGAGTALTTGTAVAAGTGEASLTTAEVGGGAGAITTTETVGVSALAVVGTIAIFVAWAVCVVLWIAFGGPAVEKLVGAQLEWARRRQYGVAGVLAYLTATAFEREQTWMAICLRNADFAPGVIIKVDFAADTQNANVDPSNVWQQVEVVLSVSDAGGGTTSLLPGKTGVRPNSVGTQQVALAAFFFSRAMMIEQLRTRNLAIYNFYINGRKWSAQDVESNGVALTPDAFDAWANDYAATHSPTWGQTVPSNYRPGTSSALVYAQSAVQGFLGKDWPTAFARARFIGKAAAFYECATEGYSFGWPGDQQFTNDLNAFLDCGTNVQGAWVCDDDAGAAINPVASRQQGGPQVMQYDASAPKWL